MCSVTDSEWHGWAVWVFQVIREVWLGFISADTVNVILLQFPQTELGRFHQYLFADQSK